MIMATCLNDVPFFPSLLSAHPARMVPSLTILVYNSTNHVGKATAHIILLLLSIELLTFILVSHHATPNSWNSANTIIVLTAYTYLYIPPTNLKLTFAAFDLSLISVLIVELVYSARHIHSLRSG